MYYYVELKKIYIFNYKCPEKVIPELVSEVDSIGDTAKFLDGDKHKVVDYAKLSVYLVDAIQEQQKQIDELKKKLEEL